MRPGTLGAWVKAWKAWKLSSGVAMGWPRETMLSKVIRLGIDGFHAQRVGTPEEMKDRSDEELVESVVREMAEARPVLHEAFIAYHLGEIRRESARHLPIKARAIIMGITPRTMYRRLNQAECWLGSRMDEKLATE